jgi:signal transduction histidine kinase
MESGSPITRLVRTAAAQDTLQGIGAILKAVTEELQGWGTLIWMAAPGSDIAAGEGRLFVLASWVSDPRIRVCHELTVDSMTWNVLRSDKAEAIDIADNRIARPMTQMNIDSDSKRFCLAPMRMEDGSRAVLEVYRVEDEPFTRHEVELLGQMAAILPALYASLADRVGFHMVDEISRICRDADRRNINYNWALQEIADRINDVFKPLEVSIFLEPAEEETGSCRHVAHRKVWAGEWKEKAEYKRGEGATGWVFENGRTVQIVDLAHYEDDVDWIQREYPGLVWSDALRIQARAREYFKVTGSEAPPLSWLGAPIRGGDRNFGVIRCVGSTNSPFYFDKWQASLLEGVGVRIGAWWQNVLWSRRQEQEIRLWEKLVMGFDGMNRLVQRSLKKSTWDETGFFVEAMKLAHDAIPGTDNSDVRLIDGNELRTATVWGRDWARAPGWGAAKFPIRPPGCTASYLVAEQKGVLVYDDVRQAPCFKPTFDDTRKLILAPVEAGDKVYGVLCIRSKSTKSFPANVKLIAGLLGQQLGLYLSLSQQIRSLQRAEATNRELIDTQTKTIGDVHHQVKSPIVSTYRAAQLLMQNGLLPQSLHPEAGRIRGLCSKVARVVRNMGMFADLSAGQPVRLNKVVLMRERLLKMLGDSCADHQILVDPDRHVVFRLDEKAFADLTGKDMAGKLVEADLALLEQCVNNLLDNAGKYSFDRTEVRVSGGIQARGTQLYISVVNQGFVVKPEDVTRMKQRGHRGDRAILSTGEGSGIGLWIVDEIMRAHRGYLAITPTQNGFTDVRLAFLVVKGVDQLSDEARNSIGRG